MLSEGEIRMHMEAEKRKKRVEAAMKELIDVTNVMGYDDEIAEGIFLGLIKSHRTLQQSFFRCFVMAMDPYSKIVPDLRNEQAVKFAKKISEDGENYFPFV
jgi:hypothetical protein